MDMNAQPRWEVGRQEDFNLDNGPSEKWIVVCRHGSLMGFARKSDALDYRASLWEARRANDAGLLDELCSTGECSAEAA